MAVVQYGPGWWFPRWWFERHKAVDDRVVKSHRADPLCDDGQEKGKKKASDGRHDGRNPDGFNGPHAHTIIICRGTSIKWVLQQPLSFIFFCYVLTM